MKHYGDWDVTEAIKGKSVEVTEKIKGEKLEITDSGSFKSIFISGGDTGGTALQVKDKNGLILEAFTDNLIVNGVVSADKFNGNATSATSAINATEAQTIKIKESADSTSYYSVSYNNNILSFTEQG